MGSFDINVHEYGNFYFYITSAHTMNITNLEVSINISANRCASGLFSLD